MRRGPDEVVARDPERDVIQPLGDGTGTVGERQGLRGFASAPKVMAQERQHAPGLAWIAERADKAFGAAEISKASLELSERMQRVPQLEADIDGLGLRLVRHRLALQDRQRLLQIGHGLPIGRSSHGLRTGLVEVPHGLVGYLAAEGVVSK